MITTCTECGQAYESGSEEQANEPERWCPPCRALRGIPQPAANQPPATVEEDVTAEACVAWLIRKAEHNRLTLEWQDIETRLYKEHDWPKLSRRQRERFPEQAQMNAIDARLKQLHKENRKALRALSEFAAATPRAIERKLEVAIAELHPSDNKQAHRLLKSILRDFRALYHD